MVKYNANHQLLCEMLQNKIQNITVQYNTVRYGAMKHTTVQTGRFVVRVSGRRMVFD